MWYVYNVYNVHNVHNDHNVYNVIISCKVHIVTSSTSRTVDTFVYNGHNDCALYCIFVYISCTFSHNQISLNT